MRQLWRFTRNVFWYLVVSLVAIAFNRLAPLGMLEMFLGLVVLNAVLWIVISALRQKLRL